ncbi:hypothetical protein HDE_09775 [Halotydeus destructor]|nr:hypothetical protein HDE_09775 [Halotydeus destructor]
MSRKTDIALGLPSVNYCYKYLLLSWLLVSIVFSVLISIKTYNQLTQTAQSYVDVELPLNYTLHYNGEISETYVFGVTVLDGLHLLFCAFLLFGAIELHENLLGSGIRGVIALTVVSAILVAVQKYIYPNELNKHTKDYLLYNLTSLMVRSTMSAIVAAPVARQVKKRTAAIKGRYYPPRYDDLHSMSLMTPPTAPPESPWIH